MTVSTPTSPGAATVDPFARQLKGRYLARRQTDLQNLAQALADRDFAAIQLSGHNMFGSGAAYGFGEITAIGERLEQAAEARETEAIRELIGDLENFLRELDIA